MKLDDIQCAVSDLLLSERSILFGYLHGSTLSSAAPRDVDVAVFLRDEDFRRLSVEGRLLTEFSLPLEMRLESAVGMPVDVQVLNRTGLAFRYRVIRGGVVLLDREPSQREEFETLSTHEYYDFRPRLEEYVREALTPA